MVETVRVPPVDYTSRDYAGVRSSLISLIPFFTDEWTDFNPSDPGITLLDMTAWVSDVLHYYIDRMAGESYLDTAITPEAVTALTRLIDYTPSGPSPAVVTLVITVPSTATATSDYTIPAGTRATTGVVEFETDRDLTIPVGATAGSVSATQGQTIGSAAPSGESVGISDGLPFQVMSLTKTPAISSTVRVFVDEASSGTWTEWSLVDTFVDSLAADRVYKLSREPDGVVAIEFGDGVTGAVLPFGAPVQVAYRIGGGESGNVGAGTVKTFVSSLPGGVSATVSNAQSAAGGSNGQTIAQVKQDAPKALRALHRAVSLDDYRSLAVNVAGVQAAASRWNNTRQLVEVAVASGSGLVSDLVKENVRAELDAKDGVGLGLDMIDPTLVLINITGTVVVRDTASRSAVQALLDAALDAFFTIGQADEESNFDRDVFESDITALIDNLDGVDHLDVIRLSRTATQDGSSWASTQAVVTVSVGVDNDIEQDITVTLPVDLVVGSDVAYEVRGSKTGLEALSGTAVFDDGSGNNGVSFKLEADNTDVSIIILFPTAAAILAETAIAPQGGDVLVITVGKHRGNQTLGALEIRRKGTIALTITGGTA